MKKFVLKLVLLLIFIFILSSAVHADDVRITATVPESKPEIIDLKVYDIASNRAKISFNTNKSAFCRIDFGKSIEYGSSSSDVNYLQNHSFELLNLDENSVYNFDIICTDNIGNFVKNGNETFKTLLSDLVPSSKPTVASSIKEVPGNENGSAASKMGYNFVNIFVAVLVLLSIFLPIIANLPLLSIIDQITAYFIFVGKNKWGIVYDSGSNIGIPKARVSLYDFEHKNLLTSKITDNVGRYGFSISPGKYYIRVEKIDYKYPSNIVEKDYHEELIEIKKDSKPIINIPVDGDSGKITERLGVISRLDKLVNVFRLPILVLGSILAVYFYVYYPNTINFLMLGLYGISWVNEALHIGNIVSFGNIIDASTNSPIGSTVVRVFNDKTGELISTNISDAGGHYSLNLKQGEYSIKASKEKFRESEIKHISLEKGGVISKKILLKKLSS